MHRNKSENKSMIIVADFLFLMFLSHQMDNIIRRQTIIIIYNIGVMHKQQTWASMIAYSLRISPWVGNRQTLSKWYTFKRQTNRRSPTSEPAKRKRKSKSKSPSTNKMVYIIIRRCRIATQFGEFVAQWNQLSQLC